MHYELCDRQTPNLCVARGGARPKFGRPCRWHHADTVERGINAQSGARRARHAEVRGDVRQDAVQRPTFSGSCRGTVTWCSPTRVVRRMCLPVWRVCSEPSDRSALPRSAPEGSRGEAALGRLLHQEHGLARAPPPVSELRDRIVPGSRPAAAGQAIGYAPAYLAEHEDGTRADWPRIPLPATADRLRASASPRPGEETSVAVEPGVGDVGLVEQLPNLASNARHREHHSLLTRLRYIR